MRAPRLRIRLLSQYPRRASIVVLCLLLGGCSTAIPAPSHGADNQSSLLNDPPNTLESAQLWQSRHRDSETIADFPIGTGDILEISVPAIEQLKDLSVRVSADGTIAPPFIGTMQVSGMTEQEVRGNIRSRLRKYLRDPQVEVFVKEYQSREVAVMGQVKSPGMYTLVSPSESILDVIGRAGGSTDAAATRIVLIPARAAVGGSSEGSAEEEVPVNSAFPAKSDPERSQKNSAEQPISLTSQQPAGSKYSAAGPAGYSTVDY